MSLLSTLSERLLHEFPDGVASIDRLIQLCPPRLRQTREGLMLLGDALVMMLRFDDALPLVLQLGEPEVVARFRRLAMAFGRYSVVRRLREKTGEPDDHQWRRFLVQRALPCAPIGGDEEAGFCVDEGLIDEIARELGEPAPILLARTVQTMLQSHSRHVAKMYIYSCLCGDEGLIGQLEGPFHTRAAYSRQWLRQGVSSLFPEWSLETLQAGDLDNYNPISASLWLAERRDGSKAVIKENLHLPVDYSRIDGYSAEGKILQSLDLPGVVHLEHLVGAAEHELLVLQFIEGEPLSRFCSRDRLLPSDEVVHLGAQLARTLASLHEMGVLYLDVKAKNVLWDGRRATLVDFGMAQQGKPKAASLLSTPAYVPPEMVLSFQATAAADVFQLGVLLFQLFTGQHPFATTALRTGDSFRESELLRYALANVYEEPRLDLLAQHEPLLRSMLQRDRRLRPSAVAVANELGGER